MWRNRAERERQTIDELRLRPVTFVVLMVFMLAMIWSIIATFALTDTSHEMRRRGVIAACVLLPLAAILVWSQKRESRAPFSTPVRRAMWKLMIGAYAVAAVVVVILIASGAGVGGLRVAVGLGALSPVPILAWAFLKAEKKE